MLSTAQMQTKMIVLSEKNNHPVSSATTSTTLLRAKSSPSIWERWSSQRWSQYKHTLQCCTVTSHLLSVYNLGSGVCRTSLQPWYLFGKTERWRWI